MVRRMIAGAAVAGAVTFGLAGMAGATTPTTAPTNTSTTGPTHTPKGCAKLPKIQSHAPGREKKANARISKDQALEKKLKSESGHTKEAKKVASEIKKAQKHEAKAKRRLNKLETKCPAISGSSSSSGSSGSSTTTSSTSS
jgi:hypothetical protein